MSRAPSAAELRRALLDAATEPSGEELGQLLFDHGRRLHRALGVSVSQLETLRRVPEADRVRAARAFLDEGRGQERAHRLARDSAMSLEAATSLARYARWKEARIELDVGVLLGPNLLADATKKAIEFSVEDRAPVTIMSARLRRARRVLRFADLECFIANECLCFRWRGGKGGLNLCSQQLDRRCRDSVVPVVLVRPRSEVARLSSRFVDTVTRAFSDVCFG